MQLRTQRLKDNEGYDSMLNAETREIQVTEFEDTFCLLGGERKREFKNEETFSDIFYAFASFFNYYNEADLCFRSSFN